MWALRAAVRPLLPRTRACRGLPTPRAAPPQPRHSRALAAFRPWGPGGSGSERWGSRTEAPKCPAGEDEGDPEGAEEEEEELLRRDPLLPSGTQRVCLVHPDVKRGAGKPQLTRAEWQVAEAAALVRSLDGWSVVLTLVVPTKTPERKLVFGRGNLERLTETIRGAADITCVFLNLERMAAPTKKELEAAWGIQVFDRFTIVLHIFRAHARTREARLQVALAELPLLRSGLKSDIAQWDRQRGGSRYILGSGESARQMRQRELREKEAGIRKALEQLRRKRQLLRQQRARRELPVVSVVGYTNCGKTTLIRALTGDQAMQPQDRLFATLDVTVHAGWLPSHLPVLYVDTVGFLSQLPHGLLESFKATLEDVAHSDLIVHVRDVSHPETELQKASVLSALQGLHLPSSLLDSMLEVHNKVDLVPGYSPSGPSAMAVSALLGHGLEELKARLEAAILRATGRHVVTLRVGLQGAQLSWLHREATVQQVHVVPGAQAADVDVIISDSAHRRFRKLFPE